MLAQKLKDRIQIYQLIAGLTAVTLILLACIVILAPFFPALLLSLIFTLATWPAFEWLQARLHQRTALAAGLMTMTLAGCFIFPLVVIGTSVAENYSKIYGRILDFLKSDPQVTAAQLCAISYVGPMLKNFWLTFMSDQAHMMDSLEQYAQPTSALLLHLGATIGRGLLDISLGVIISFFFFRHGMHAAVRIRALIDKFGGEHGQRLLKTSKNTLIGVVYGVLGTALLQGVLAALGFWITGVPGAHFLGLLTFFLSLLPMGPPLLWGPAALWLFSEGETAHAVELAVWGIAVVASVDNFMKPYFISRGSDLPLLLVLLGILGGAIAFGFIGIFIGPTLLSLAYTMILDWTTARGKAATHFSTAQTHDHTYTHGHMEPATGEAATGTTAAATGTTAAAAGAAASPAGRAAPLAEAVEAVAEALTQSKDPPKT